MTVTRFSSNPIITPERMNGVPGDNINGPSLVRVPDWVKNPLGRYYLYFAHHNGTSIRLAYADELAGPWTVYAPGTLQLEQTACRWHIASPDVFVDEHPRRLRMYFHGPHEPSKQQVTFLALSDDGLSFRARTEPLGPFYMRVFEHGGAFYGIAKASNQGVLLRSPDGLSEFEPGPVVLEHMRHCAVRPRGEVLEVYYSRIGDDPERILMSRINLRGDWRDWRSDEPREVLAPDMPWEGADCRPGPSKEGLLVGRERQLRDPCIYQEDGRAFLLYSVAGEQGIAVAALD